MGEKHILEGEVRLQTEPCIAHLPTTINPQLIEQGIYVTNFGWWLKIKGLDGKKIRIIVEEI